MQKDRAAEERYLEKVEALLEKRLTESRERIGDAKARLAEDGQTMWEDVKRTVRNAGVDTFDEMVEILQNATHMEHEENRRDMEEEEEKRLLRMRYAPYFGRVDFRDEWEESEIYVGTATLEEDGEFLVYDWRSPVASLYYEGGTGKAGYTAPLGRIEGEITRKRQYVIENGKLSYYLDTDLEISDGILREALAGNADLHLKTIVSTIQREQNAAIRRPWRRDLLITGPAGCGKTSVGMHRLAWMLYENRERLRPEEVLILTQSAIFSSYLTGVLPALGERETRRADVDSLWEDMVPGLASDGMQGLCDAVLAGDEARRRRAVRKLSPAFEETMRKAVEAESYDFPDVVFLDDVVFPGEELSKRFREDTDYPPKVRAKRLADAVESAVDSYFAVGEADPEKPIRKKLSATEEALHVPMDELVELTRIRLSGRFRSAAETLLDHDLFALYETFLVPEEKEVFRKNRACGAVDYEDLLAMARLAFFREGRGGIDDAKVILVDEAQDQPRLAHKLLRELYPYASFTVLADGAQALLPGISSTEEELKEIYRADAVRFTRSFRSVTPVARFARGLIGADYEIFARDGREVEESKKDLPLVLEEILRDMKDGERLLAVTRSAEESRALYLGYGKKLGAELVDARDKTVKGRFLIAPVIYAKGLEFDRVVYSRKDFRENRAAEYLAATRALHRLTVTP